MKIVFDVASLGCSSRRPAARSGIFRVAQETAIQLLDSKECEAALCVSTSYLTLHRVLDHFKYKSEDAKLPIICPDRYYIYKPLFMVWEFILPAVCRMMQSLWDLCCKIFLILGLRSFPQYLKRLGGKILVFIKNIVRTWGRKLPVPLKYFRDISIYHSPWDPIPEQIRNVKGLKRIITIHDLAPVIYPFFFTEDNRFYFDRILNSIKPGDWVICVSQSTKEDLCRYVKIDPARVFVVYSAANKRIFYRSQDHERNAQVRAKYGIPHKPYLMCLNTLEPRKNTESVIRAFLKILDRMNDEILVLVGAKGWKYGKIFEEASNPRLNGKIFFTEYVADEDLAAFYSDAVCFVYPSFYEGFGLPVLEAMQCATPVITSYTSSLPEIIQDAGLMVSPTDEDALGEAMISLMRDDKLRRELSLKAMARANEFSWDRNVRELIETYKFILK